MTEYVEIEAQELNDYISSLEDENEALKIQLAEIKAQAIFDAIDAHKNKVLTFGFDTAIRVNDLIKYANQQRQHCKAGEQ